jgi:superfamily II DNA or RNA helicase
MLARVAGEVRIRAADLGPEALVRLRGTLRVPNPRREQAERRRDPRARFVEPFIELVRLEGDEIVVPRGAARHLLVAGGGAKIDWDIAGLVDVPAELAYTGQLRDYQTEAVDALVKAKGGVVVAPCGAGKTEIGLAALARFGRRSLVVVPTLDLVEQWSARARDRGIARVGSIGGGRCHLEDLTVATMQSARKKTALLAEAFGAVLVDECHHVPANTLAELLGEMPARIRIGLTATPNREDSLTPVVGWTLGPTVYAISQRKLEEVGAVARPRFETLPSSFDYAYSGQEDWPGLLDALEEDSHRLALVVGKAAELAARCTVLVLTGRVRHAQRLAELLVARGLRAVAVTGDLGKAAREQALSRARHGSLDVLVATQLADEGLDVPRLGAVILAWPQKAEGRIVQRVGRVLRPLEGKEPLVVDVVDLGVGVLKGQANKRARIFRATWGGR